MPAAGGLMRGQGLTRAEREARPRSLRMGLNPGPSARSQPASNHRGRAAIRGDWIFHYGCIESRHPPVQVVPNRSQSAPAQHESSPGGLFSDVAGRILRFTRVNPPMAGPTRALFLPLPWNNGETARLLLSLQTFSADRLLSRIHPYDYSAVRRVCGHDKFVQSESR